jgi:hypothetical protein
MREALVGMSDEAWAAAAAKRCRGLVHLLGIEEREAGDTSIKGRLTIIAKLKAAKRAEIARSDRVVALRRQSPFEHLRLPSKGI